MKHFCVSKGLRFGSIVAATLATAAAFAQTQPRLSAPAVETFGHADAAPAADFAWPTPPSVSLGIDLGTTPAVMIPMLTDEELAAIHAQDAEHALLDKSVRYGVRRLIGADPSSAGAWTELVGVGRLWSCDVTAGGAMGVRLNFSEFKIPGGAALYVYSPTNPERVWGPYDGSGIENAGDFWTPTTFGDTVRVELFIPETMDMGDGTGDPRVLDQDAPDPAVEPPFVIGACQHIYRDPLSEPQPVVGTCHNSIACFSAWANVGRAAAGIGTINSDALFCSGTMITTTANDQTPYWLTANHCISSASTATNSEIYWLYQPSTCGGSVPALSTVPQSAVCTRLSFSAGSDYSLLMVEGVIPSGLFWAGWSSATVANATPVTCVHHPDGSWKRISFANKISGASAGFIRADWYDAPTEPGSSGSGLFRDDTQQLVGQLYGGPSSCASESYDDYGAFATTYSSISSLLAAGSDDAYEQNDTCATARTMTAGTYSNLVVKRFGSGDEDWYAISVAAGATLTATANFTNANGNVDMQLYASCGGTLLRSGTGTGNSETFSQTNSGASATTYYLRVYLANDTRNTYSLTLSTGGGGGGSNNACSGAIAVTSGTYSGSTASATNDGSASCGSSTTTRDVWYKYTAGASGTLSLNTCGSSYDTVLSVHSACPGTSANQLACNDDCGGSPCGGLNSCLTRAVTAGVTYYIRVSGYNGASGSFTLNVTGP